MREGEFKKGGRERGSGINWGCIEFGTGVWGVLCHEGRDQALEWRR
jgi:hypothetical protein